MFWVLSKFCEIVDESLRPARHCNYRPGRCQSIQSLFYSAKIITWQWSSLICRTIFDSLIETFLFNNALHQPASISRVLDCKKGRGTSGTRGVVQVVQPHLMLVPSNSLLAGSVERGNEKNGSFCITLHCIAFNTLSHSISPYALQRSPPENMDRFISLCITLHHAGGLVRHWILGERAFNAQIWSRVFSKPIWATSLDRLS